MPFFLHQNRRVVVNSFERMSVLPVVSRSRSIVHVPHSAPKGASIPLYFGALAVPWPKKSCKDLDLSSSTKANLIVLWLLYKSVDVILATGSLLVDRQLMISRCHSCLRRPVSPTVEEGRKTLR